MAAERIHFLTRGWFLFGDHTRLGSERREKCDYGGGGEEGERGEKRAASTSTRVGRARSGGGVTWRTRVTTRLADGEAHSFRIAALGPGLENGSTATYFVRR